MLGCPGFMSAPDAEHFFACRSVGGIQIHSVRGDGEGREMEGGERSEKMRRGEREVVKQRKNETDKKNMRK